MIKGFAPSRRSVMATATGVFGLAFGRAAASTAPPAEHPDATDLFVTYFGARGDGTADDSSAFEHAIAAAAASGRRLRIPTGRYRITRTLEINRGIRIEGDGIERTVLLGAMERGTPLVHIRAKETDSIIGFGCSGLRMICDRSSGPCDGIKVSTGGKGAAIHQMALRDLFISHVGTGISLSGVVYRSCLDNITISGSVANYGIYCDANFEDVTYNSFWNIEVTNVGPNSYAFWIHSNYSNFVNLTSDGCCYFSSPGGALRNLAVEGISADKPAADWVVQFNQMQTADGINLIGISPDKCAYGIKVVGQGIVMRAIRCMSHQPHRLLDLSPDSTGVMMGVSTERPTTLLEAYLPATTLDRWVLQSAEAVTNRQLGYAEGEWQPTFEGWTTTPKVHTATWERIGRRVFLSLSCQGGIAGRNARISNLPTPIPIANIPILGVAARPISASVTDDGKALIISPGDGLPTGRWSIETSFRKR